jgi:hypothetical protein
MTVWADLDCVGSKRGQGVKIKCVPEGEKRRRRKKEKEKRRWEAKQKST